MNNLETKQAIVNSLAGFANKPLAPAATALFESLGYRSQKRITLKPNTPETFVATFAKDKPFNPEPALLAEWQSVDFLFQLTDEEVRAAAGGNQQFLFESKGKWNGAEMNSYLFLAVALAKPHYTRTELSGITRAVNRLFPMPAMMLFRHGDNLTLAIINRRLHKHDESKDVLEKVTLIKDIRLASPHRAHIEILHDLSFDALREKHDFTNFVALQAAWQKSLDSSELNKRFFIEVANWYFWALSYIEFPKDAPKQDGKDHISVIRLITRLMFCWFVKEKGLVPDLLFDERKLPQILKGFAPQGAGGVSPSPGGEGRGEGERSVYYRAILQNLFFATLNTEMDKRGWTKEEQNFMAHSLYRFREDFQKPDVALDLFKNIPFLNGGLFECLDKDRGEKASPRYERIDGFSRRADSQPVVPDFLFFGPERDVDLSADYGDNKFKKVKVRGLIHTLNHYKFTVAENTPIEEEIALDPELSGKVFENLLAAYNPETGATARKQTGSFYTPREIVNYMVDEALIACLKTKVEQTILSAGPGDADNPVCAKSGVNEQTELSAPPTFKPYNPEAETHRKHRRLPHWTQEGRTYFVTFRLADSLPQDKLKQWVEERNIWLKFHPEPWSDKDWEEYDDRFGKKLEEWLDAGYGACHLARPEVRAIVEECLNHFDGQRYDLGGYVVMPNHVHMLIRPRASFELSEIMKGIKGVSSRKVRQTILSASSASPSAGKGQTGLSASPHFWMDESFDHVVRSQAQFAKFQLYIAENPVKAGLKAGSFTVKQTIVSAEKGDADNAVCKVSPSEGQTGLSASPSLEARLRHLFAYNNQPHQFTAPEVDALIAAIDSLKSLDPAVGSGAFPMGILHKLVFILGKLDPRNEKWKERQIARVRDAMAAAEKIEDATVRERAVRELEQQITGINEAFEHNELDYGRKLYLIENCIYGVDIQPIAVQIAKMRFFISLIVDQKVEQTILSAIKEGKPIAEPSEKGRQTGLSASHWNLGVRPLPNLETKFVAANTLIGVNRPGQQLLRNREIDAKEASLREVRRRHFLARTLTQKRKCREQDEKLRAEIAELLKGDGWDTATARRLASWNPYDQNASADFFDPEWMFGIVEGFDTSIGNPPYVRADEQSDWNQRLREQILATKKYETLWEKWDLFVPFIERAYKMLKPGGVTTLIVSDAFCHSKYAQKPQNWFLKNTRILRLDFCADLQIFDAAVHNLIYFFQRADGARHMPERRVHSQEFGNVTLLPSDEQTKLTYRAFFPETSERTSFGVPVIPIAQACYVSFGCRPNSDEKVAKGLFVAADLVTERKDKEHPKPYIEAKDIERWTYRQYRWLEWGTDRSPDLLTRPTFEQLYEVPEKIVAADVSGAENRAAYDSGHVFHSHTLISFVPWHSLHGVRNNSLKKSARYRGERPPRPDLPKREELEATSRRFAVKYLLGVMNSSAARDFLRANRRSNIYLYPDDWKKLPIPDVPPAQQKPVERLVERILAAKQKNPAADTSGLEREIDQQVYALYGLTPEEIKIVEDSAK